MTNRRDEQTERAFSEDPWAVFELDDDVAEPEPEYGDFWGEVDDDCDNLGG
jgi:hypothetical protein